MKKKLIQKKAEELANICLEDGNDYHGYNDHDLVNATLIFSHFLMESVYQGSQHLSFKDQCTLAAYSGKAVRELIIATTGKDMHKLIKE